MRAVASLEDAEARDGLPQVMAIVRAGPYRSFEDVSRTGETRHLGGNEFREPTRCG